MRRNRLKLALLFLGLIFIFYGCIPAASENGSYYVRTVIDGDTVILTNGKHLRYIGIDTPESRKKISGTWVFNPEPYAVVACELNKSMVEGKKVRLEFDKEPTDKYGRWLAYVFVNDKMINEELLRHGYATVYTIPPNVKYVNRFSVAEDTAKKKKMGLWSLK